MAIAAVPRYLGRDFKSASPGMRFGYYLELWGEDRDDKKPNWETRDYKNQKRGQAQEVRKMPIENKVDALNNATHLNLNDKNTIEALRKRQQSLAEAVRKLNSGAIHSIKATNTAPFTTGLGNEHPLENGFAFLNPYGLPYLPGSGVKGVIRQAATELASGDWGDNHGWNSEAIEALFGRLCEQNKDEENPDTEQLRGALTFWDVIPNINRDRLHVEVMTPHFGDYYQGKETPHESGMPKPITFLTVPQGSNFQFFIQCKLSHLQQNAPELLTEEKWRQLIDAAIEHAFTWCGFGAKTAVGYGAMKKSANQ